MDARRKRLLYRSTHRGMKETDLLLGRFAAANLPTLTEDQLDDFERLMDQPDNDLMNWILGRQPVPPEYDTDVMRRIIAAGEGA